MRKIFVSVIGLLLGSAPVPALAQNAGGAVYGGAGITGGIATANQIIGISNGSIGATVLSLLFAVLSFMALAAVVMIVIAGISLVVSVGDDAAKDKAKKTIGYALGGLVIIFLAGGIVSIVVSVTGGTSLFGTPPGSVDIADSIVVMLKAVLQFMALAAVVTIVIAGIMLVVSGGEESAKDRAKKIILYTVVGLIIILLASAIVTLVESTLLPSSS